MLENDQMFSGEVGLLVLTVIPILVAALIGIAILVRRENAAVIDDPGNASRLDNQ